MSFYRELKRRNVLRVGAAYVVTAWLIIQVVETVLPAFGFGDASIRITTLVFAIGLMPALILAWAFELTPEGLKRDNEVDHSISIAPQTGKKLDRMIMIVLAMALGYFAFDKFVLDPAEDESIAETARQEGRSEALLESYGDRSIAVLAFDDMSPASDHEYLSDGIAEEILNLLARIPEIRVISRSSAFSYKGKNLSIPIIAEQLNVAHVLEGSVRKAGDRIRITAQLIEARTDTHLWSETYDRTLDDVFAIQDEIAATMVEQLKITLMGEMPKTKRIDPDAYFLFLQGDYYVNYVDAVKATELFEQAIEIEPDFIDAWLGLMRAYYQRSDTRDTSADVQKDEYYILSEQAFAKARALDPEHPYVQAINAWDNMVELDYVTAARLFENLLELYPHDWDVVRPAMIFTDLISRFDISLALGKMAIAQDPFCAACTYRFSRSLLHAGHYKKAEQEIQRFRAVVPGVGGETTLGISQLMTGDLEGARKAFSSRQDALELKWGELLVRIVEGDTDGLAAEIGGLDPGTYSGNRAEFLIAELYAMLGDIEQAFHWLKVGESKLIRFRMPGKLRSPFLGNLHDDPRWMGFLERAGVAPYQLEKIDFNPRLPRSARP